MSEFTVNRREFVGSGVTFASSEATEAAVQVAARMPATMAGGYSTMIPRSKIPMSPCCGTMVALKDGRIMLVWGTGRALQPHRSLVANYSSDGGRSWSDATPLRRKDGSNLPAFFVPSIARLKSGRIGLVQIEASTDFNNPSKQVHTVTFHVSDDEGKTWSQGIPIPSAKRESPYFDQLHVLSSGRLIVPFSSLMGPTPGPNSRVCHMHGQTFDNRRLTSVFATATAYYSDDEGETWHRSFNEVFAAGGLHGAWSMHETCLAELPGNKVLMLGHSGLGRIYRAISEDGGQTWMEGEPTPLQASGPVSTKRIPGTDDVLLMWAQISGWENMNGYYRHRLSYAITSDGGKTFRNFKNLESLDDVAQLDTEPIGPVVVPGPGKMRQPIDTTRYHRAPGPLRCDHPFCYFHEGNAIIGYGMGVAGDPLVITRFYGETMEHFCERFGFEAIKGKTDSLLGSNKIRVIPIKEL